MPTIQNGCSAVVRITTSPTTNSQIEWLDCWADWPRSLMHLETLGQRLADGNWRQTPQPGVRLAWWAIPFRNLAFLMIVLAHVVRRLLPPY